MMPSVLNEIPGGTPTTVFNLSILDGYLEREFVKFYTREADRRLEWTPIDSTSDLQVSWVGDFAIQLNQPIPEGIVLVAMRETPTVPMVHFRGQTRITERSLDIAHRQPMHRIMELSDETQRAAEMAQEALDVSAEALEKAEYAVEQAEHAVEVAEDAKERIDYAIEITEDARQAAIEAAEAATLSAGQATEAATMATAAQEAAGNSAMSAANAAWAAEESARLSAASQYAAGNSAESAGIAAQFAGQAAELASAAQFAAGNSAESAGIAAQFAGQAAQTASAAQEAAQSSQEAAGTSAMFAGQAAQEAAASAASADQAQYIAQAAQLAAGNSSIAAGQAAQFAGESQTNAAASQLAAGNAAVSATGAAAFAQQAGADASAAQAAASSAAADAAQALTVATAAQEAAGNSAQSSADAARVAGDAVKRANHTGTQAISTVSGLQSALDSKQAQLTAGPNISISGNVISATDTTYSALTTAQVNAGSSTVAGVVSPALLKAAVSAHAPEGAAYTAGSNVSITGNVISATDTTYGSMSSAEAAAGTGTTARVITAARLKEAVLAHAPVAGEASVYTAGANVQISGSNVISATDTTYAALTTAQVQSGTSTVAGIVSPSRLKEAVLAHAPGGATYSTITQAEVNAGTSTASRLVTPALLRSAVEQWSDLPILNDWQFTPTSSGGIVSLPLSYSGNRGWLVHATSGPVTALGAVPSLAGGIGTVAYLVITGVSSGTATLGWVAGTSTINYNRTRGIYTTTGGYPVLAAAIRDGSGGSRSALSLSGSSLLKSRSGLLTYPTWDGTADFTDTAYVMVPGHAHGTLTLHSTADVFLSTGTLSVCTRRLNLRHTGNTATEFGLLSYGISTPVLTTGTAVSSVGVWQPVITGTAYATFLSFRIELPAVTSPSGTLAKVVGNSTRVHWRWDPHNT